MAEAALDRQRSTFTVPDVRGLELNKISRPISGPDYIPTPSHRGRDIFQRLFFNTGGSFLFGFSSGGMYGCVEGLRTAVNPSLRIRLNSVINAMSKRGSKLGNALGIIGNRYQPDECIYVPSLFYELFLLIDQMIAMVWNPFYDNIYSDNTMMITMEKV